MRGGWRRLGSLPWCTFRRDARMGGSEPEAENMRAQQTSRNAAGKRVPDYRAQLSARKDENCSIRMWFSSCARLQLQSDTDG